ncbi:hypothetical protein TSUD_77370 [Trifolium subterraneum]|uniref:Repressor of RNA polymerase III transcription n=1 Tax=Trifolium subterraneum TaxID=3900 RepID=A0A2Z6MBH5_TRISU|nr:hypothetical protein TSUD_77370 [Trifolium subterraneum]
MDGKRHIAPPQNEHLSWIEGIVVVTLADCEIYGYLPDSEADPLPDRGAIWSFNFLFYNRKLKRIVTFRLSCFSNLLADGFSFNEMLDEYDEEIFANMDI